MCFENDQIRLSLARVLTIFDYDESESESSRVNTDPPEVMLQLIFSLDTKKSKSHEGNLYLHDTTTRDIICGPKVPILPYGAIVK